MPKFWEKNASITSSSASSLPLCRPSVSSDLTVLGVLVLCVCLYIPGWVACKRADVTSEVNRRVHYLSDNSPHDPYLYAVTIHTGPCSAACMSAKVKCLFVFCSFKHLNNWSRSIMTMNEYFHSALIPEYSCSDHWVTFIETIYF